MSFGSALKSIMRFLTSNGHGDAKSFEKEVEGAGIAGRVDSGMKTIPASKIVGSVGRAQNLRSDFFYKTGRAMTARFVSIGKAMEEGKVLPPIEVYKAKVRRQEGEREIAKTEYYVVDGHHRVAMAKKLGQDYLDAHVVEYRVKEGETPPGVPLSQIGEPESGALDAAGTAAAAGATPTSASGTSTSSPENTTQGAAGTLPAAKV